MTAAHRSFGQSIAFETFFQNEVNLEANAYTLDKFGKVEAGLFPWIEVESWGWLYLHSAGSGADGFWAYDYELGWIWTSETQFPHVYSGAWREWYYFLGEWGADRWFHNYWTNSAQIEGGSASADLYARAESTLQFAADRIWQTAMRTSDKSAYPSHTNPGGGYGNWRTVGSGNWVSGFFPAELWLMYDWSDDTKWRDEARLWMTGLEEQQYNEDTHDLGFMLGLPFSLAYELDRNDEYRKVLVNAASSLMTRYSDTVGSIRSWSWGNYAQNGNFTVIVDNMMNLELPVIASGLSAGVASWEDRAIQHALTTADSLLRPNGSTYHVVIFDENTGAVRRQETYQGFDDNSTWSRGQAWAIYGFTSMYAHTGDGRFLETARLVSDYFLERLGEQEWVPAYDFDAPLNPIPRDSSAAAVAASGFIELSWHETDAERAQKYWDAAEKILFRLTSPAYLARSRNTEAILVEASSRDGQYEQALIYGDYYFLEALLRYRRSFEN